MLQEQHDRISVLPALSNGSMQNVLIISTSTWSKSNTSITMLSDSLIKMLHWRNTFIITMWTSSEKFRRHIVSEMAILSRIRLTCWDWMHIKSSNSDDTTVSLCQAQVWIEWMVINLKYTDWLSASTAHIHFIILWNIHGIDLIKNLNVQDPYLRSIDLPDGSMNEWRGHQCQRCLGIINNTTIIGCRTDHQYCQSWFQKHSKSVVVQSTTTVNGEAVS